MSDHLKKLVDQRIEALKEARKHSEVLAAGPDAQAEEAYRKANDEVDRLGDLIDNEVKREERSAEFESAAELAEKLHGKAERRNDGKPGGVDVNAEVRAVALQDKPFAEFDLGDWRTAMRAAAAEERAAYLNVTTATEGPELVVPSFARELYKALYDTTSAFALGARVLSTSGGESLTLPIRNRLNPRSTIGTYRVAEGGAISQTKGSYGTTQMSAYKYAKIIQESRELSEDSAFDVAGLMGEDLGEVLGEALGFDLITGDGSSKPTGVQWWFAQAGRAARQKTFTNAGGTPDYEDVLAVVYHLGEKYARRAKFLTKRENLLALRTLTDPAGHYVFDAKTDPAQPDTILGYPIVTDPDMPAWGVGSFSLLFGDFSRFYVRLVRSLRVEWSTEYAWDTDLISVKGVLRADSEVIDDTAFVMGKGAAA